MTIPYRFVNDASGCQVPGVSLPVASIPGEDLFCYDGADRAFRRRILGE
jgi:hypothetical protein